jgi:hypothetical protein
MGNLRDTHWIGTLHLNAVRVLSATATLILLYLIGRVTGIAGGPGWANVSILNVLTLPLALLIVGLSAIFLFRLAGSLGVPFMDSVAGLMALVMIVFIAVGDPLIWLVRKYYPAIVPVDQFGLLNPRAVIMVQRA